VSDRTKFCGYVVQRASPEAAAAIQGELDLGRAPLAVVSGGGGGDAYPLLSAYAEAVGRMAGEGLKSAVFLVPRCRRSERASDGCRPERAALRLSPDLVSFLPAAGRSRWRAATPSPRCWRTSGGRGRAMTSAARRGCGRASGHRSCAPSSPALTPDALVGAVRDALSAGSPPAPPVDFGGLRRVARRARRLLGLPDAD
jgi:hypothetical protein